MKKSELEEISRRMDKEGRVARWKYFISITPDNFEDDPRVLDYIGGGCHYNILLADQGLTILDIQNDFVESIKQTGLFTGKEIGVKDIPLRGEDPYVKAPEKLLRNIYLGDDLDEFYPCTSQKILEIGKSQLTTSSYLLKEIQKPTWISFYTQDNKPLRTKPKITKNELLKAYVNSLKRIVFGGRIPSKKQELIYYIKQELDWYRGWHNCRDVLVHKTRELGLEKHINLEPYTRGRKINYEMFQQAMELLKEKRHDALEELMKKRDEMLPEIIA